MTTMTFVFQFCDSLVKGAQFLPQFFNFVLNWKPPRKLAEQTDNPIVKNELLGLASVCEEVADNIEDHLTDG